MAQHFSRHINRKSAASGALKQRLTVAHLALPPLVDRKNEHRGKVKENAITNNKNHDHERLRSLRLEDHSQFEHPFSRKDGFKALR